MIRNTSCTAFRCDELRDHSLASANRKSEMTGTSDVLRRWPSIVAVMSCRGTASCRVRRLELLIEVDAVDDVRLADARPRGRHLAELVVERDQAELILEEHGREADGRHRRGRSPPRSARRSRRSASTSRRRPRRRSCALLSCSNSRVISGLKLVSDDCAQSIDDSRSPGCQSRMPTKLKPAPLNTLRVIAERELLHPLQDEQLDLGDFARG